mgnify:CR=1 FL=1|jgi:uncharacterized membrane-anchored protein YhcB (DUF1043 family)
MNNCLKIRIIKEGELKMDVNNLTVIITLINLIIFIAIPIGIVVFIIKVVKNQKKMKSDIELLNKRLSELENK